MERGRLKKIKGTEQFIFISEGRSNGRTVRRTSERMSETEARIRLSEFGLSTQEIESEIRLAGSPFDSKGAMHPA